MPDAPLRFITVKLIVEDVNNLSDADALATAEQLVCEGFMREERQDHPRCKLLLIEVQHTFRERVGDYRG